MRSKYEWVHFRRSDFAIFIFCQHEDRFHIEPSWVKGTKVLVNDLGHMTKSNATNIYGNIFFYRKTGLVGRLY